MPVGVQGLVGGTVGGSCGVLLGLGFFSSPRLYQCSSYGKRAGICCNLGSGKWKAWFQMGHVDALSTGPAYVYSMLRGK